VSQENIEIVETLYSAWAEDDFDGVRDLLDDALKAVGLEE
jgi:hypothetical protein